MIKRNSSHKKFLKDSEISSSEILLALLALAGLATMAILAPNALQLLARRKKKKAGEWYLNRRLKKLIDLGFVKKEGNSFSLTDKGERQLAIIEERKFLEKEKRWDGKWRIIIFDIKEKNKKARDLFRLELVANGFKKLQNSVWISKNDGEELMRLIAVDLQLDKEIIFIESEKVSGNFDY
ncbi:MAG: hypothetical protein NTV48_03440 [Candidatus Vogelbacteria bacterium]|nr:hypothetical protein [Candidatus Vogelbacteria bacterium]